MSYLARDYEAALRVLESRRRPARPVGPASSSSIACADRPSKDTPDLRGTPSVTGMREWLSQLGHSSDDIDRLNVVHIAGTKGKGSTCAFTESILRAHGKRTGYPRKTGLYTSPHLLRPEERIRINFKPITPDSFAGYLFEIYDRLPQLASPYDPSKSDIDRGPRALQLYALLALHVFIREQVDVTILETHNGGEYDSTNIVANPVVTAVTTLGMDHIEMLGPTIERIAWHKSGIFKPGSVALSATQDPSPLKVLRDRAADKGEQLTVVPIDSRLPRDALQIQPGVQKKNASLAVAIASAFLGRVLPSRPQQQQQQDRLTSEDINAGIRAFTWPGRFHTIRHDTHVWFLDAAHNDMSVGVAAEWYTESSRAASTADSNVARVLIFSHANELRSAGALLDQLAQALRDAEAGVRHVIFTTYIERRERMQHGNVHRLDGDEFSTIWSRILPDTTIWHEPTVQQAIERAETIAKDHSGLHALVTGSQHLVGPAISILGQRGEDV